jgi:hypothetical protein
MYLILGLGEQTASAIGMHLYVAFLIGTIRVDLLKLLVCNFSMPEASAHSASSFLLPKCWDPRAPTKKKSKNNCYKQETPWGNKHHQNGFNRTAKESIKAKKNQKKVVPKHKTRAKGDQNRGNPT